VTGTVKFVIDAERCVACLACVRVCPVNAVAVPPDDTAVQIVDEACIQCGLCVPSCPHDAIDAAGDVARTLALISGGNAALILGTESAAHFFPASPEQVVNACYAAGFRVVSRGVIGDELVAAEYLRLWREGGWGTLIRSTDPVVVETIRHRYPELIPYLAPVAVPAIAEARYLRSLLAMELRLVYAGVVLPGEHPEIDAAITFRDLQELFRLKGISVADQPEYFSRVPQERRRHLSAAGGMPLELLQEAPHTSVRFRKLRGLDELPKLAHAVAVERLDLGFVDILSWEGSLDHPLAGPSDQVWWRRQVVQSSEPPRSHHPVVESGVVASVGAVFQIRPLPIAPDPMAVQGVLDEVGLGPNGRAWDCRACGYDTCRQFAEAAVAGRASLRQCVPWLARSAEESRREAATDLLTGLATFRVMQDRLQHEIERSKRSGERFTVLFLDLDKLKEINDRYGHEAGNEVLRAVAQEIRRAVRASDLAARYGGDEFVVILTRTERAGAERVGEALRAGIEQVGQRLGHQAGLVTVSIGIAEYSPGSPSESDVLERADRALYAAKASGRNTVI